MVGQRLAGVPMIAIPSGFSPEEYLAIEQDALIRHEYRQGLVYAMAGGSDSHNRLCINLLTAINLHLGDRDCQLFSSEVKVNYADAFYYYPDVFVTCDPRDRQDRYVKRFPILIVEVLSASTAAFDRGDKFADYQRLPSLQEYGLIHQDRPRVDCYRRPSHPGAPWPMVSYGLGDRLILASMGLDVAIADLYRGVELTA
jgi:Uma2 family endonuclease